MVRIGLSMFLLLLASCASDSTDPATPTGTATIVIDLEGDAADYHVVLQRADGRVHAYLQPDATGRAEASIRDGDMLTLVYAKSPQEWRLTTVADLRICDTVALGRGPSVEDLEHSLLVDVDYPGTATTLTYAVGCINGGGFTEFPRLFDVRESCLSVDREFNLLLTSTEPGPGQAYFAYATEIAIESASVDLVGQWRTDWQDFTLEVDPGEPVAGSVNVTPVRGGRIVGRLHNGNWTSDGTTPVSVDLQLPRGFSEFLHVRLDETSEGQERQVRQRVAVTDSSPGATVSGFPPRLVDVEYRDHDAGGPALLWEVDGDPGDADYFEVILEWQDEVESREVRWQFLLPPTARSLGLPELPDEVAAARLPAGTFPFPSISWVADSIIDGFGDFRIDPTNGSDFESSVGAGSFLRTTVSLPEPEIE